MFNAFKNDDMKCNLRSNFFWVVSAIAFIALNTKGLKMSRTLFISFLLSVFSILYFASQIKSLPSLVSQSPLYIKVFSLLSTLGVCIYYIERRSLACLSVMAFYAVYFYINYFLSLFLKEIFNTKLHHNIRKSEIIAYFVLFLVLIALMTYAFLQSRAFYYSKGPCIYDIIYTSDSQSLTRNNVFLYLLHGENDIRQPLFMLFAAPFVGAFYFFAAGGNPAFRAIMIVIPQIILLLYSNFLLADMLRLSGSKRIIFMVLIFCTYTYLLSILVIEQYIFAYFWLILCIYQFENRGSIETFTLMGAAGTLITSFALAMCSIKNGFKEWLINTIKYGVIYILIMIHFFRTNIIIHAFSSIKSLLRFSGYSSSITEKMFKFMTFLHNCFIKPSTVIQLQKGKKFMTLQLSVPASISIIGVTIFLLAILSLILNRNKKVSILAGGWMLFSVIILFVLGWGMPENGLILYSLYFSWAYIILLFQLLQYIEDKCKLNYFVSAASVITIIILLIFNVPAMSNLIDFAIKYWPN